MFSRIDQLRFVLIDYFNARLHEDSNFHHMSFPYYVEAQSSIPPSNIILTAGSHSDENPFMGDSLGRIYSHFTLYKKPDAPNTSIVNFQIKPSFDSSSILERQTGIYQIDFMEEDNIKYALVSFLKLNSIDTTDSSAVSIDLASDDILEHTIIVYQGNAILEKDLYWTYDDGVINFIQNPSNGDIKITPLIDPPLQVYFLTKDSLNKSEVKDGEIYDDLIPDTRIYLGRITSGDIFNIKRSLKKEFSYDIFGGYVNMSISILGSFPTESDAEIVRNKLLDLSRELKISGTNVDLIITDIAGSMADGTELDVSGDVSKDFEITFNVRSQFQLLAPKISPMFKLSSFAFEADLEGFQVISIEKVSHLDTFR